MHDFIFDDDTVTCAYLDSNPKSKIGPLEIKHKKYTLTLDKLANRGILCKVFVNEEQIFQDVIYDEDFEYIKLNPGNFIEKYLVISSEQ